GTTPSATPDVHSAGLARSPEGGTHDQVRICRLGGYFDCCNRCYRDGCVLARRFAPAVLRARLFGGVHLPRDVGLFIGAQVEDDAMTDAELAATVEKLRNDPFFTAQGPTATQTRVLVALYDRLIAITPRLEGGDMTLEMWNRRYGPKTRDAG